VNYDKITERTGFQVATPEATGHFDAVVGETILPPATLSLTAVLDPTIDSPTTYAPTQVASPDDSTTAIVGATQFTDGAAAYIADSTVNINVNAYGYILIDGIKYYAGTPSPVNFLDDNSSTNFRIDYTWSPVTGATGYVLISTGSSSAGNPNWSLDVGNVTAFSDDGLQSGSETTPTLFSTIAFPQFNTTLNPASSPSASFNYGSGAYTADNSSWFVEVWTYRTHFDGTDYFLSSSTDYNLGTDDGSTNPFNISGSYTPGDGDGQVVILKQNGTPIDGYDDGNAGTITFNGFNTPPAITPAIASYVGVTRNFYAYGKVL